MLRVLHVVRSLEVGGLERMVCELVDARGYEHTRVACLTASGELAEPLRQRGATVYDLSAGSRGRYMLLRQLVTTLHHFRPDVLHCHNMYAHAIGSLVALGLGGVPVVLTKHGTFLPRGRVRNVFHKALIRRSRVVAVSQEIHDKLLAWAPSLKQRLWHIPNGIKMFADCHSLARSELRKTFDVTERDWLFISVSRIAAGKRLDVLLQAFSDVVRFVPTARLAIVGDGPELSGLMQLAGRLGLSKSVAFLGQRMDIPSLLFAADGFVLSSDNEGLPMALLEAMAAKLPVVATSVGEVPSVVEEGRTGYIVPPRSPALLGAAMSRLARDRPLAHKMGRCGQLRVSTLFGVEKSLQRYEVIYKSSLRRRPKMS